MFGVLGIVLLGAALFFKPGATSSNSKPSATIEEYGRYSFKGRIHPVPNRNASGGVDIDHEEDMTLVEQTDQIPCRVGETWGIRIRPDVPADRWYTIRQETYHPPIK